MDPRGYVRPGQKLRVAASQINALNAMMRPDTGFQAGSLTGYGPLNTIILARNSTGSDLARWGVMKITGIVIDPNDGDTQRRSFEEMPCVVGGTPTGDIGSTFMVAIEPIKENRIGRVAVAGVVQVTSASLTTIRPHVQVMWEHDGWALVRIGGNSNIRLGKITGSWNKNTTKSVTRLRGDGSTVSPTQTFTASNYLADISIDCGERKVVCGLVESTWILIAAEC